MKSIFGAQEFAWLKIVGKFGGAQIIVQFFGFCSGLLLVRTLNKDVYALYTFANVMLGTMSILADSGVGSGAMAMAGRVWNEKRKLSQVVLTAIHLRRFFVSVVLIFLSPVLFIWLSSHGADSRTALGSTLIIAVTLYLNTGNAILGVVPRILLQTDRLQAVEFSASIIRFLAIVAATYLILNLTTVLLAGAIASLFQWLVLLWLTKNDFHRGVGLDSEVKTSILKIVSRHAPNSIYYCIQGQIIIWLLGIFGNPAAIADAGALGRLAAVFAIIGNILAVLVMPRFSRCHSPELLWIRFHQVLGMLAFALSMLILVVFFYPEPILWILGKNYQNLKTEFFLMVISQSINCVLTAISSLNIGRGWILSPWIVIPTGFLSYYVFFLWIGASTLKQVLFAGIFASIVSLIINYFQALISIKKMKTAQEKA